MSAATQVSVVVVNHNGRRWLAPCLQSVLAQDFGSFEVLVVDNGSSDNSVEEVERAFPQVKVVALTTNRGFAGGNNAGAGAAAGDVLVFLNNDTVVAPGWLRELTAVFDRDSACGLTTSQIVFMDHPDVLDSAGDGYLRAGGAFKRFHGQPTQVAQQSDCPFGACGAAFAIRRPLFESLSGFDEDLFLVYEDVDLSYRARLLGWRVQYVPTAIVRHAGSSTLGRFSRTAVYYGQRNLEWVWLKDTPFALLLRSLPSHLVYSVAGVFYYAARGHLGAALAAKGRALRELPRILAARRRVQASMRISPAELWSAMTPNWTRVKRSEKRAARAPGANLKL